MAEQLKEGYIYDYISGLQVKATPEEVQATQVFSKILVEDYGYPKENIQTRPQFHVKKRPSDEKKEYPIDIAVFSDNEKTDDNLFIIVECKKKNRKDGRKQLENYMTLSSANLGVWFNGEERLYLHKRNEKDGKVIFNEIPNIPCYGETLDDIGARKRKDLLPTHNLKSTFKAIRNYLAANAIGATRDEVLAQQLINIIFCKIYDEKNTPMDQCVSFRVGVQDDPEIVKKRLLDIFQGVKRKYKDVFTKNDVIDLDDKSISYIVGELQNFCFLDVERDIIADAFETFISHALKGGQGQFFTPRNIVKMIVTILDPTNDDILLDPACGSGGFLVESLRYIWKKIEESAKKLNWNQTYTQEEKTETAIFRIRGIEKDGFLAKVTKAYMAILGDGRGSIFCDDSLEIPSHWDVAMQQKIKLESFSLVVTNPPFGSSINVEGEDKLKQYEFGYKWKDCMKTNNLKTSENPQVLFIERCLQFLIDGGKMAIILPETYLHGPSCKYIIKRIEENNNIFAIIDIPHNTFRPNCNAKCVVMFIQKNRPQQDFITMGIVKEMGHNHQGKPIYRFDKNSKKITNEIWDDTSIVMEEFKHPNNENNKNVFTINKNDIVNSLYVPRYYWTKNIENIREYANDNNFNLISVQQLLDEGICKVYRGHGAPPSEYKGKGNIFYVRAGDIMDWDIYKNPTSAIPCNIYEEMVLKKEKSTKLKCKDILFVKEGSYRVGDVALISEYDTDIFLNHHTLVFRVEKEDNIYNIDAFYLLYMLSHKITKRQFYNKIMIDTTLPNIGDRWKELLLPLHKDPKERVLISNKIADTFERKWKIQKELCEIKDLITDKL